MNRRVALGALALCFAVGASTPARALTSPRESVTSRAARAIIAKDNDAYQNRHAWVEKARAAKNAREAAIAQHGPQLLSTPLPKSMAITGTMNVPVLPGYFSNQVVPGTPITQAQLQAQFFGNNPSGSVSDYYTEVSFDQFTVSGTVYAWTKLDFLNSHYAGSSQGLDPGDAHTGDLIKELLDARDGAVDFGQYDNDGPDGTPNSGDDDGFVDVLCVVHAYRGGECPIAANIASHSWRYSAWPVSNDLPYITNDARFGGGFIRVDDYNITPALSCNTPSNEAIEIGTLCHELGHGLGLPDLYAVDPETRVPTGEKGAGDWSLMATGNWNTPDTPAHLDAWCKKELGWLVPTVIGWQSTPVDIPAIETDATAFMLPFTDERFRRSTSCVIDGAYSFYCGLTETEGNARGWFSPEPEGGYGSNWHQTIERDFTYTGTGGVVFRFTCTYDLEPLFDYAYAIIEVNGTETVLLTHTGASGGTANIPLAGPLAPLAGTGGTYTLKFRVVSDLSFDDADGGDPSSCGAFVFDNVNVTGGGEAYVADFENDGGGWHQDTAENPTSEYWLIENRRRIGFDQGLHEQGLLIWHVDEEVAHAVFQLNNGVRSDVRGLVLEEADGQFDLNNGINSNRGEAEDVFPGPLAVTSFDSGTTPDSDDNTARPTQISVTNISAPGATMTATLRAGDPAPSAASVTPNMIDNDQVAVVVDIAGATIRHGATFRLVKATLASAPQALARDSEDIVPTSLAWLDQSLLRGTLNVYSKTAGAWDLVVTNPDGQAFTLANAVTLNHIVATKLVSASIVATNDGVRLRYQLVGREEGEVLRLYRSPRPDGGWVTLVDDLPSNDGEHYEYLDDDVDAGQTYFYALESNLNGEVRELHRGTATVPARELVLEQNQPNPFNPRTTIRFYLPERGTIALEVYDARGALVRRLARGDFDGGAHTVDWDGTDANGQHVASGVYVYRLVTERRAIAKKMVLLK